MRLELLALVPLQLSSPRPCAFRPADPRFAGHLPFWPPKSHPKFHSIFERILASKMVPKASQNGAKIDPKSVLFSSSFSSRFFFSFGRFFCCFSRCPTLDLIAIYSTSVGSEFFRQVRRSSQNYLPNSFKLTHKRLLNLSKNAHKKNI